MSVINTCSVNYVHSKYTFTSIKFTYYSIKVCDIFYDNFYGKVW